jgi:hypothetical protein
MKIPLIKESNLFFNAERPFFSRSSSAYTRDYSFTISELFLQLPQPSVFPVTTTEISDTSNNRIYSSSDFTSPFSQYSRSLPFSYRESLKLLRKRINMAVPYNPRDELFGLYYRVPSLEFIKYL